MARTLLADPDIKRWYDNIARGSRVTADVYLRRLNNFCEKFKLTPKDLVSMSEKFKADPTQENMKPPRTFGMTEG